LGRFGRGEILCKRGARVKKGMGQARELLQSERLRPTHGIKVGALQSRDHIIHREPNGSAFEVVQDRLAPFSEKRSDQIEKEGFVGDVRGRAFSDPQLDKRREDLGRRPKGARRHSEKAPTLAEVLDENGEGAVLFAARGTQDAVSDLALEHDGHIAETCAEAKHVLQNSRRHAIREIAHDAHRRRDPLPIEKFIEIQFEDIPGDKSELRIRPSARQVSDERVINLDSQNASDAFAKESGQGSASRPDLQDDVLGTKFSSFHDPAANARISQEMLSEAFSSPHVRRLIRCAACPASVQISG